MEHREAIEALLERLRAKAESISTDDTEESVFLLYLGRMVELIGAAMVVLPREDSAAAIILIRSALECYVDLHNLAEDRRYILVLRAMLLEGRSSIFHFKTEPMYGLLVQDWGEKEVQKRGKKIGAQFEAAVKEASQVYPILRFSARGLTVLNRFRIAGMEEKYHTAYAWLSMQAHNAMEPLLVNEALRNESHAVEAAQNDVLQSAIFHFAVEMLMEGLRCCDRIWGPDEALAKEFMAILERVEF